MALNQVLIAELQQEAASTRKMLERVPAEHMNWQPHEKSMSLTRLATHIAELPGWISMILTTNELDLASMDYKPTLAENSDHLTGTLDEKVAGAIAALQNTTDEQLAENWTLRKGDHVMFALPKAAVIRSMAMSHLYHHRGQLSVFLRLLDVPLPGIYGPTRDEMDMMAAAGN